MSSIQQANWSRPKGLEESIRIVATNARKDPDLPLCFVTTIRTLLSKQNCVRLKSPDPKKAALNLVQYGL